MPHESELAETILALLAHRQPSSSICPSDAARAVGGDDWRGLMDAARAAAATLADAGRVQVTQGGEIVDVRMARGPVRIRLPR